MTNRLFEQLFHGDMSAPLLHVQKRRQTVRAVDAPAIMAQQDETKRLETMKEGVQDQNREIRWLTQTSQWRAEHTAAWYSTSGTTKSPPDPAPGTPRPYVLRQDRWKHRIDCA